MQGMENTVSDGIQYIKQIVVFITWTKFVYSVRGRVYETQTLIKRQKHAFSSTCGANYVDHTTMISQALNVT